MDGQADGGKEGANFGFHISGSQAQEPQVNKQLAGILGPMYPASGLPVAQCPGGKGRPRKLVFTEIFVSKRREWLDCVFPGG